MNLDYSVRLPFEVSQVYAENICVNYGIVVTPLTLEVFKPTMNGVELKHVVYKDFPTMPAGSGNLFLKIIHEDKENYFPYEWVPIISTEIIFNDESESTTETYLKIAELDYNSETGFMRIDQLLKSDVYPLIYGTKVEQ